MKKFVNDTTAFSFPNLEYLFWADAAKMAGYRFTNFLPERDIVGFCLHRDGEAIYTNHDPYYVNIRYSSPKNIEEMKEILQMHNCSIRSLMESLYIIKEI
jgi:hypothetical protein